MSHSIIIRGAREHNLKNLDVEIPRDKLVVMTGLSGSGKSSLAFDTIYAEGQRRYVESLSAYARQFLQLMQKPDVDSIEGLSPAISIEQKTTSHNPRSTVGTVTEIHDYMRLLWARVGVPYSPATGLPIEAQTVSQMVDRVLAMPEGTRLLLLAPVARGKKGEFRKEFAEFQRRGFERVKVDGTLHLLSEAPKLDKKLKHDIEVVVDRVVVRDGIAPRLADSFETALALADGVAYAENADTGERSVFSAKFACPESGFTIEEIEPRLFSFNSPQGACPTCDGLGTQTFFDPMLVVPDDLRSIKEGAVAPWTGASQPYYDQTLDSLAKHYKISTATPWGELPERVRHGILHGTGGEVVVLRYKDGLRSYTVEKPFEGVLPNLERRYRETDNPWVREDLSRYQAEKPCPACKGYRLKPEALSVKIAGRHIGEASEVSIRMAREWFGTVSDTLTPQRREIARRILREIEERLQFLVDVGLDYLSLGRSSATLSGDYLSGRRGIPVPDTRRPVDRKRVVRVVGATGNNLKNVAAEFPLGTFTCVTGVSGGGKSSLVIETLYKAAARRLMGAGTVPGPHERIEGLEQLDKIIDIDQSPIGRTPRSNPATYTGLFAPIRDWFAELPESRARGYKPGRFSLNVKGGRCETCEGDGLIKIEMHFLPDIYVTCEVCKGRRYNRETLEIVHKDKSIADILNMTVDEALEFFQHIPFIKAKLQTLHDVGLHYIRLGQSATTLSGGEAQRVKLSRELSKRATGRTMYILDEPTTGLHFADIQRTSQTSPLHGRSKTPGMGVNELMTNKKFKVLQTERHRLTVNLSSIQ